jgi:hypothetical protein
LVGDVHGLHDHEAAQQEPFGRQELDEKIRLDEASLQPLPRRIRERQLGPDERDLYEAPVELQPEVLIESGGGVGGREDDGDVATDFDAVRSLENELVGQHEACGRQRLLHAVLLQEVRPALERSVRVHERASEGRRRIEGAQLEREQGRSVFLLPEGRRKERAHHQVDERAMFLDHRQVLDNLRQLGRGARLLTNETRDRSTAELMVGGELCPEGDQRGKAELASEREGRRIPTSRYSHGGRSGHDATHRRHARILPA